jgi:predicted nucleic acid-binding protein
LWLQVQQENFGLPLAFEHLDVAEELIGDRTATVSFPDILRLATESGCSAYDCQYVALAQSTNVPLITHDGEVLDAFPDTAFRPGTFLAE